LNRGFNVNVNFVAHPEQLYLIPMMRAYFEGAGIRFHVDPFAEEKNSRFVYSVLEKSFLNTYVGQDRAFRIQWQDPNVVCTGGHDYLQVDPDGNAYRCMTQHLVGVSPIGNILDKDFVPNKESMACNMADQCGGCDRDKVTIR
jgi:sulfatase maturation enzyme AslB (radical SAM superfamily)